VRTSSARPAFVSEILAAVGRGTDVYLFLIGITALAEFAQLDGVFAWVATRTVRVAGHSRMRLFAIVYGVGIGTTALLSNDATVILLTPAVLQALAHVDADPLPYAIACALVANAASFVLPISNPANLLVFAGRMPALGDWLAAFALPSLLAIAVTFAMLVWRFRTPLRGAARHADIGDVPPPSRAGIALLCAAALVLIVTSSLRGPLGATTFACAAVTFAFATWRRRSDALAIVRAMPWFIVPLTAALFAIVAAIDSAGALGVARTALAWCARLGDPWTALAAGGLATIASNAINNLPVALGAGQLLAADRPLHGLDRAVLIGVNLGPNLSVSGSLATILWLGILRRYGIAFRAREFLAIGIIVAPPALIAALLTAR
jgi:arsenical pump membrane protein